MEGVGSEVSLKIRSAIKAKLVELGTYVDEELPDYIMVLVANKKTKDQMDDDLSLFLGHNTERFTSWLHHVLQKLNAAALLQVVQDESKKKEDEDNRRAREEDRKRDKAEEAKRLKDEERKKLKEKEKTERKRKTSEKKEDKKEKKLKKSESPESHDKGAKEKKHVVAEPVKATKPKETPREKEKENRDKARIEEPVAEKSQASTAVASVGTRASKRTRPQTRGKISSADIFRAEAAGTGELLKTEEEEEGPEEDMLVLRADIDELGLELEEEPAPRKTRAEHRQKITSKQEAKPEVKPDVKPESKVETKAEVKQKSKSKVEVVNPPPKLSVKERLGSAVAPKGSAAAPKGSVVAPKGSAAAPKQEQPKEKVSVLERLGSAGPSSRRVINLREESSFPSRSESSSSSANSGLARAVSSAITSAQRSVCVLPATSSATVGKKLEARVRPLMSRSVESRSESSRSESRSESSRSESRSESSRGDRNGSSREAPARPASTRVVSAVGAVLKRSHSQVESDEEEYDPKKPQLSGMASKVEVTPRPRRVGAIQANTALILRAMADAHKSVNKPSKNPPSKPDPPQKKQKGELFTRSYREREARQKDLPHQEEMRVRKIAITVPNATRKESEELQKDEEKEQMVTESSSLVEEEKVESMEGVLQEEVSDVAMEEVEEVEVEVEEEVVDEGIEEDQPMAVHEAPTLQAPRLGGRENTKFIVTLEGVDTNVYQMREESPDIRSRLGGRTLRSDSLEEVEEYIEEVEEWEEEDISDTHRGVSVLSAGMMGGVKPRLKTPAQEAGPGGKIKERCGYWPACKAGDACPFHHPTFPCKAFPNCKFGDKCLFIHPNCMYDAACTRRGCVYTHASSRSLALASATIPVKHKIPQRGHLKIKCKYFPKCTNLSCPFLHPNPKACFFGVSCTQAGCPYTHPFTHTEMPNQGRLKWIAPKAAAQATSTPASQVVSQVTSKEKIAEKA